MCRIQLTSCSAIDCNLLWHVDMQYCPAARFCDSCIENASFDINSSYRFQQLPGCSGLDIENPLTSGLCPLHRTAQNDAIASAMPFAPLDLAAPAANAYSQIRATAHPIPVAANMTQGEASNSTQAQNTVRPNLTRLLDRLAEPNLTAWHFRVNSYRGVDSNTILNGYVCTLIDSILAGGLPPFDAESLGAQQMLRRLANAAERLELRMGANAILALTR
ncbi:hypothetical protein G7046_g5438 [Stylonectria norvegica]|nr:hypothetical protein G7046_g5438 [Stylonectria norvegica]